MLPESFTRRVMAELGPEEGRALCEALEGPAPTSVRLHPQRPCRWSGAEAIPWSPAGRYLTERPSFTLDPAFHAGAYYVQEASSQFLAHVLAGEEVAGPLRRAGGKDDALCVARRQRRAGSGE